MTYFLLFAAVLAAVADIATTAVGITMGATEGNPMAAIILDTYGWPGLAAGKLVIILGLAVLLNLSKRAGIPFLGYAEAVLAAGGWGLAAIWNLYVMSMIVN